MYYDIASRLRHLRKNANLSQEQVALSANITPAFLGQLERGEKNPTVVTIEKICGVFNISLSDFFSDQEYIWDNDATVHKTTVLLKRFSDAEKNEVYKIVKGMVRFKRLNNK